MNTKRTARPEDTEKAEADPWYDFYDDDESRTRKGLDYPNKILDEQRLEAARRELFQNGSAYQPTNRDEIVGIDNVLHEIDQMIHWLANASAYQKYGARLEPGVIFEGEPGTGKTLVSRYIATASGARFINVRDWPHNGSLFKDTDIKELFRLARDTYALTGQPIVLFWDEFENGAIERSSATPEQAATVSQLTAELDGIHGKNEGILLVGCTNYIYGIDAALRRSGRMGVQIEFHAPDRPGKKLLLDHYVGQYPTTGQIDVETLSYFFDGDDTAADIEESCMEAWRHAVYRTIDNGGLENSVPSLSQEDLVEVFLQRLVGPPAAFINMPMEDRARVAVHEVGHAVMALVYDIPLRLITVQPGKKSLGRTITASVRDHIGTIDEMISDMRVTVGSIAAEQETGLPASTGAMGDVEQVNKVAAKLVDNLYAGEQTGLFSPKAVSSVRAPGGPIGSNPNVSNMVLEDSDFDISTKLRAVEKDGTYTMGAIGHDKLWEISNHVNEVTTMTGVEFEELFREIAGDPAQYRES